MLALRLVESEANTLSEFGRRKRLLQQRYAGPEVPVHRPGILRVPPTCRAHAGSDSAAITGRRGNYALRNILSGAHHTEDVRTDNVANRLRV